VRHSSFLVSPSPLGAFLFFLPLSRRPPISPFCPYTTLFRSHVLDGRVQIDDRRAEMLMTREGQQLAREALAAFGRGLDGFDCFRSEEHTSELQSRFDLGCRLLLEKKKVGISCRDGVSQVGRV